MLVVIEVDLVWYLIFFYGGFDFFGIGVGVFVDDGVGKCSEFIEVD